MKRLYLLIICCFVFLLTNAQFTQKGKTLEYHGRQNKTIYTSPVSISFQGCSSTTNDRTGNLSLMFPSAKAGNVVSCTELKTSNPQYVIFNRNDFDIWTLGDRVLPIILCEKSKIDNYIAIYTKVQMEAANAKYKAKKKELEQSELDKQKLYKQIERLKREHFDEIKEIKENALVFAYIDEEKLDSLQYEQHKCILNNNIEGAVEIGKQIDFKSNISKQLSNFEKSVSKTQELGLKLFQKAEALYLHITNCELLSTEEDSLKEDYDILIKCYRTLIEQYPNNFKCSEDTYNKTKVKLGNILYKYVELYLNFKPRFALKEMERSVDSLTYSLMREASSYKNSNAILWIVENGENYLERKSYAKKLLAGVVDRTLSIPGEYSFYDIKDICESFPDFQIEDKDKILYYSIVSDSTVSVAHFYCKNPQLNQIKIPQAVTYQGKKYIVTQIGVAAFGETSHEEENMKFGILGEGLHPSNNFFGYDNHWFVDDTENYFSADSIFSIKLPKTIEYVGSAAFFPRLGGFNIRINGIPNSLKILRSNSFQLCVFPKQIVIPNKVEIIEEDALPAWVGTSFSLPKSLKVLHFLNGSYGGNYNNSFGKVIDINNNPNFRLIDGALYTADSSYVFLGTVGQNSKILHITRNMKFDEDFFNRMHYSSLCTKDDDFYDDNIERKTEFIDSICFDERNPYYSYYDHCIYTKQLDTLLYVLPSADNVRLATNLKRISVMNMPSIHYEIPIDISIEGLIECLDVLYFSNRRFELYGNEYTKKESDSENQICKSEFVDTILKDNRNNPKLLCAIALLYLENDYFNQAYELLDSIKEVADSNSYFSTLLIASCYSYIMRINTYIEEYKSTNSSNHDDMVEICLKLRDYYNNTADYLNTEVSVYNAFYNNWILGAQESYNSRSYSLYYMEKGIPYALKLITKFDMEKYKNIVSDFYSSLANIASRDDDSDNSLKALQYANKSLELNSNNIDAYEALATYFYYNGGVEKNKKIKEIITKVENIDSTYKNSKDNLLYQLLDDNSKN